MQTADGIWEAAGPDERRIPGGALNPAARAGSPASRTTSTRDADAAVRAAAARHPNLPQPRPAELLDDAELGHHAAANPGLPTAAMELLVASGGRRFS